MFNPALIKPAAGFIASVCTSRVIGKIIATQVQPATTLAKIECAIAGGSLGMIAGAAVKSAVYEEIESVEEIVKGFKEAKNQQES